MNRFPSLASRALPVDLVKGQIISKRFFLAEDSPKKQTKTRRIVVKTKSFVRFLGESLARKKTFRDYLTFTSLTKKICLVDPLR